MPSSSVPAALETSSQRVKYRELTYFLAKQEVQVRYRQSIVGVGRVVV